MTTPGDIWIADIPFTDGHQNRRQNRQFRRRRTRHQPDRPIVGVGILIGDLWDYKHTVAIDRPLLRRNIDSYLKSMERSLLDNPETGIMAAIQQLESSIIKHLPAS